MKQLISKLFYSVLILGLVGNSGLLSSYAEEKTVISETVSETSSIEGLEQDSESLQENSNETMDSSNQEETKKASSSSTVEIPETTSSDLKRNSSDSSLKKSTLKKSQFATTQPITTTDSSFDLNNCEIEGTLPNAIASGTITLTGYHGEVKDLVIPSKVTVQVPDRGPVPLNVKVKINGGDGKDNTLPIPASVHSITFRSVDGTKVGLETTGNWNNLFNVNGKNYNNLVFIDLSGLDMSNVTSMNTMFNSPHIPNIEKIDFGDNTLSKVTDMSNAFNGLKKLKTINQQWTFGNVTNFNNTFFDCQSLTDLNLTDWNVSNVINFKNMFYNCLAMDEFRMDNWHLNSNADLGDPFGNKENGGMFCLFDINSYKSALIVAQDPKLLAYSYSKGGYKPKCEIRINANTGQVAKDPYINFYGITTDLSYYFSNIVISTDQYNGLMSSDSATLQQQLKTWLEENVPMKSGYALKGWAPTDTAFNQQIQSITTFDQFMASQAEFKAEWVSDHFSTSSDNTKLTPSGTLGLAYYPKAFTILSTDLQSSGKQEIPISKITSFNLGVKDRTRTQDTWQVTARLVWNGKSIPNAYIQTTNPGQIKENISTGSGNYSPDTDLKALSGNGIVGTKNYRIDRNADIIMKSDGIMVNNGVYDYNLGEVKLVIPDVSQVPVGSYSGEVAWNLVNGPA